MSGAVSSSALLNIGCCTDLYQLPIVRQLMGGALHPGGLAVTRAMAKRLSLSKGGRLLDVACGYGTSALMIAQTYKCAVVGMDASAAALDQAREEARRLRLDQAVSLVQGDAGASPFAPSSFTGALCECATSLFDDRLASLKEVARVLEPGGRLALSDVTFRPSALPGPLDTPLARMLCIPLGVGPEDFRHLLKEAGLEVEDATDCSEAITGLVGKVQQLFGSQPVSSGDSAQGPAARELTAALDCTKQLVLEGDLGYWAFIARKPAC
ncbi:MAG: methyltransferase domain-containing protein [Chloroflexi bacterium]|nr:methyltransferase domain-containing protein [Chloroflexota bacterium]